MSEAILKFDNFGFQYNAQSKPTLYDICLEIRAGEKILIAGPSGCGKSTLVHCINGLIPFSYKGEATGSLKIKGRETKDLSIFEISHSVGTVLQDSDAQFVGMTVAEDIAFAPENDCIGEPALHNMVKEAAQKVDVGDFLKHAPGELSGGQKQRVSLAGVLVNDVDILLFDEPLANLDPATGKQAMELIDKLQQQTNAAVIIVEHRLEDVLHRDVDRIVIMNEGRIVADMVPDELLSSDCLEKCGIREPLYITALKYAGVNITPDKQPHSIGSVTINESDLSKIKDLYTGKIKTNKIQESKTLLKIENLDFTYGESERQILKNISLEINKGEMVAVVGTNGAGKTTFAKVICGFEKESAGSIIFDNKDLRALSIKERAEHIGYVMQNPNQMISKVMIMDEVMMGLKNRGIENDEARRRAESALKICGLWKFRNWPVSALSFGQKKRVTIASILVLEPDMLILDEPTAGQDYRHYTEIMEFLTAINQMGVTVVMITHDMHLMLEYADRAIVFSKGNIIADKACAEVLTNEEIISRASLKETSLYNLALKCNILEPTEFVQSFIDYERENYRKGGKRYE